MIDTLTQWFTLRLRAEWERSLHEHLTTEQQLLDRPLTKGELRDIGLIVNSDQFEAFRTFLIRLAVGHYTQGRRSHDDMTHAYNRVGQLIMEIVHSLDSYREKNTTTPDPDDYDL